MAGEGPGYYLNPSNWATSAIDYPPQVSEFSPPPPSRMDQAFDASVDRWTQIAKDIFFAPANSLKAFNENPTFMNALGVMPMGGIGKIPIRPPTGIRAYHGSPHDFDRFDMSRIGTGEGAQAYGHGLYFAENPEVAANYKMPHNHVVAGNVYDVFPTQDAAMAAAGKGGGAIPYQGGWVAEPLTGGIIKKNPGKMYEVNINAKPEQFLDWDRPLNQQSQHVQGPLRAMVKNPKMDWSQEGSQFIRELGHDPQNSEIMNRYGIPGIRYLDQGSRGPGTGTSNYVLFNDKIIDIMKKWGLAGMLGGATAPQMLGTDK